MAEEMARALYRDQTFAQAQPKERQRIIEGWREEARKLLSLMEVDVFGPTERSVVGGLMVPGALLRAKAKGIKVSEALASSLLYSEPIIVGAFPSERNPVVEQFKKNFDKFLDIVARSSMDEKSPLYKTFSDTSRIAHSPHAIYIARNNPDLLNEITFFLKEQYPDFRKYLGGLREVFQRPEVAQPDAGNPAATVADADLAAAYLALRRLGAGDEYEQHMLDRFLAVKNSDLQKRLSDAAAALGKDTEKSLLDELSGWPPSEDAIAAWQKISRAYLGATHYAGRLNAPPEETQAYTSRLLSSGLEEARQYVGLKDEADPIEVISRSAGQHGEVDPASVVRGRITDEISAYDPRPKARDEETARGPLGRAAEPETDKPPLSVEQTPEAAPTEPEAPTFATETEAVSPPTAAETAPATPPPTSEGAPEAGPPVKPKRRRQRAGRQAKEKVPGEPVAQGVPPEATNVQGTEFDDALASVYQKLWGIPLSPTKGTRVTKAPTEIGPADRELTAPKKAPVTASQAIGPAPAAPTAPEPALPERGAHQGDIYDVIARVGFPLVLGYLLGQYVTSRKERPEDKEEEETYPFILPFQPHGQILPGSLLHPPALLPQPPYVWTQPQQSIPQELVPPQGR
ncbi:MAG: hypothetical protein RML36_15260 [Anaerolineae bacterium]|nr:hypothetical protein [Anaerolineae bacterium]